MKMLSKVSGRPLIVEFVATNKDEKFGVIKHI